MLPEGGVVGEADRGGHDADGRGGEEELAEPQRQAAPRAGAPGQLHRAAGLAPERSRTLPQTPGRRSAAMRAGGLEGGGSEGLDSVGGPACGEERRKGDARSAESGVFDYYFFARRGEKRGWEGAGGEQTFCDGVWTFGEMWRDPGATEVGPQPRRGSCWHGAFWSSGAAGIAGSAERRRPGRTRLLASMALSHDRKLLPIIRNFLPFLCEIYVKEASYVFFSLCRSTMHTRTSFT